MHLEPVDALDDKLHDAVIPHHSLDIDYRSDLIKVVGFGFVARDILGLRRDAGYKLLLESPGQTRQPSSTARGRQQAAQQFQEKASCSAAEARLYRTFPGRASPVLVSDSSRQP